GHRRAQKEYHERPVAQRRVDRQREHIEGEIVSEERIAVPKRHGVTPLQEDLPVARLRGTDEYPEQHCPGQDHRAPRPADLRHVEKEIRTARSSAPKANSGPRRLMDCCAGEPTFSLSRAPLLLCSRAPLLPRSRAPLLPRSPAPLVDLLHMLPHHRARAQVDE